MFFIDFITKSSLSEKIVDQHWSIIIVFQYFLFVNKYLYTSKVKFDQVK